MAIRSPYEGLQIPERLVSEFFGVFARFEFTMKECGYLKKGAARARPDWDCFATRASAQLKIEPGSSAATAVDYLVTEPPFVQGSGLKWNAAPLEGKTNPEKALHAVVRVRNNLFHGGKHTPQSPAGRDEKLVSESLVLLYTCIEQIHGFRDMFETTEF